MSNVKIVLNDGSQIRRDGFNEIITTETVLSVSYDDGYVTVPIERVKYWRVDV